LGVVQPPPQDPKEKKNKKIHLMVWPLGVAETTPMGQTDRRFSHPQPWGWPDNPHGPWGWLNHP